MNNAETILPESDINAVWGNARFGPIPNRAIVNEGVLKVASGYNTGHTLSQILRELGLVKKNEWVLTSKGREYLWNAFKNYTGGQ